MKRPSSSVNSGVKWTIFRRTLNVQHSVLMVRYQKRNVTIKCLSSKMHLQGLFSLFKSNQEVRVSTSKKRHASISQVLRGTPRQNSKLWGVVIVQDRLNQYM